MRVFFIIISLAAIIVLPNLAWLATSTLRIENRSHKDLWDTGYRACETKFHLGPLAAGARKLAFLPSCGDDTLTIVIGKNPICQVYVEGELYHIDVEVHSPSKVICEYDDPFTGLFVAKMILYSRDG